MPVAEWPKIPVMEALIGNFAGPRGPLRMQVVAGSHLLLETDELDEAWAMMCAYNVRLCWFAVAPRRKEILTEQEVEDRYAVAYKYYTN